jgi:ribonuclease P protein subunit RPR2
MRDKAKIKKRAEAQIRELFRQAESSSLSNANRYVKIALKISTKTKTPIPRELKRRFCKKCKSYLVPGKNCRVRVSRGKIVYYCLQCKKFMRFVYK